jgi:hypothetical protein
MIGRHQPTAFVHTEDRPQSLPFTVHRSPFAGVRRSQDIGNTVTVLVSAIWRLGSIGFFHGIYRALTPALPFYLLSMS